MAEFDPNNRLNVRLGSDAKFPIAGNFSTIAGVDVLLQDLQILLLTMPGERVQRPLFGCTLRDQIWENIDSGAKNGKSSIKVAIETFEPRVNLTSVEIKDVNRNTGLIIYVIRFVIKSTDTSVNLVFPFRSGTSLTAA